MYIRKNGQIIRPKVENFEDDDKTVESPENSTKSSTTNCPMWVYIVLGVLVFIIIVMLLIYIFRNKSTKKSVFGFEYE